MDWATFFANNSQSLFTLAGVLLGSVITFVIGYINVRSQSLEREKDRQEQRREAKTQLALELMKNDIKVLEDTIDNMLKALNYIEHLSYKKIQEGLSREEIEEETSSIDGKYAKFAEMEKVGDKLAHSLGDQFYSHYENFFRFATEYMSLCMDLQELDGSTVTSIGELRARLGEAGGVLHTMLREKLISIRDA
jgi:hypothetical protein